MNEHTVEHLPELNSLLIKIHGPIQVDTFPQLYTQILQHKHFKKDINLIWNALSASIVNITISDLKSVFYHVKETEAIRGKSCSAWVFPRGDNYEAACLFKAAFAAGLKIRYEAFSNMNEAKDWIRNIETRGLGSRIV